MTNNDFQIDFTDNSLDQLNQIKSDPTKRGVAKAISKSIGLMCSNLRHPSLHTHKYDNLRGPNNEEVFESYAQNKTPGAYRIFWYYGPGRKRITVLEICPHP